MNTQHLVNGTITASFAKRLDKYLTLLITVTELLRYFSDYVAAIKMVLSESWSVELLLINNCVGFMRNL